MRRGVTLLELVIVVVIVSILSVASLKAIGAILVRSYKAKELTRLSLESQIALDQISALLQERVPATTIGYDGKGGFAPIEEIVDEEGFKILEWIGFEPLVSEDGNYSGFIDLLASNKTTRTLATEVHRDAKAIIFAGSFDRAAVAGDFQNAFGWHSGRSDEIFEVQKVSGGLKIVDAVQPKWIYEKYYLLSSAYAIARGADIDRDAACLDGLDVDEDTLLLFYDYYPWKGESFCADPKGTQSGKATILMRDVVGFWALEQDYTLRLVLEVQKEIRGFSPIRFTKMKVVF